MHGCQGVKPCGVHRAPVEKVRRAYKQIITAQYEEAVLDAIFTWTERVLLEFPQHPALDDQTTEVIDSAELAGRYFVNEVRMYLEQLYETN